MTRLDVPHPSYGPVGSQGCSPPQQLFLPKSKNKTVQTPPTSHWLSSLPPPGPELGMLFSPCPHSSFSTSFQTNFYLIYSFLDLDRRRSITDSIACLLCNT